jgi:hypothetical protein
MSMLNFHINRGGRCLPSGRRPLLVQAKTGPRKPFGGSPNSPLRLPHNCGKWMARPISKAIVKTSLAFVFLDRVTVLPRSLVQLAAVQNC